MSDGILGTTIAPNPDELEPADVVDENLNPPHVSPPERNAEYRYLETRPDGTATIGLPDGRQFVAEIPEGVKVRKGAEVDIKAEGEDKEGVPTGATVSE